MGSTVGQTHWASIVILVMISVSALASVSVSNFGLSLKLSLGLSLSLILFKKSYPERVIVKIKCYNEISIDISYSEKG
jgi:hypothetical protein